jgi:hypothetical protein
MTAEEEEAAAAGHRLVRRGRVREGRVRGWQDEMPADVASQFDAITRVRFGDDAFLASRLADAPSGTQGRV